MNATQFFILLGTIYLVPDMNPRVRKNLGLVFMILAIIVEIVK